MEYKTGLPLDKDIRDSQEHMNDQEAIHGTWTIDKDPAKYANKKEVQKSEGKEIQFDQKVQTEVDVRSDPPFNSHEGYETRYMNPSEDKDIVEYKTDNALDSDIISTQAHYKDQQTKQSHDFDPTKFLAQTQEDNIDEAISQALPQALSTFELAPQTSVPNA